MLDPARYWYRNTLHFMTVLLLPFAWLFSVCVIVRRWLYHTGIFKTHHFAVPIIIVGNITVGGTGKTPFVIWLAKFLQSQGYHPGIVSRGYGSKNHAKIFSVQFDSSTEEVGDEAILLARHTHCPMVVGADRVAAVRELLQHSNCNIVISDDGLQHYRLGRSIEIAIVDGARRFGNQYLLPAGPLREPISRLKNIDFVVVNNASQDDEYIMSVTPDKLVSLKTQHSLDLAQLKFKKVHAVAGIGHPERFFDMLRNADLDVIPHAFPDHYRYSQRDLHFNDENPIIMTEKDAVKCQSFADERFYYLENIINVDKVFQQKILLQLKSLEVKNEFEKHSSVDIASVRDNDVRE